MAMIKLENVNKSFGDLHVLKDVNLEVEEGEKLVIIGPSGSGKSTTVRCMNFLEAPSSGHVYIDGTELTSKNKTKVVRESRDICIDSGKFGADTSADILCGVVRSVFD